MEFIVQLFRALANRERIRILRLLPVFREMTVSAIAEAVARHPSLVSDHLKVLAAAGLVWRRRSGCFVCFTALTHPRRLQIIRLLSRQGAASLGELGSTLSMSRRACERHVDKLRRRGFIVRVAGDKGTAGASTKGKGLLQAKILHSVRDYLGDAGQ